MTSDLYSGADPVVLTVGMPGGRERTPEQGVVSHRSAGALYGLGIPVTRPSRVAADLLDDKEDPEAVAHLVADALRAGYDYPGIFADALVPYAARFGLRRGDGLALLRWFLDLVGDPDTPRWTEEARAHVTRTSRKTGNRRRVMSWEVGVDGPGGR